LHYRLKFELARFSLSAVAPYCAYRTAAATEAEAKAIATETVEYRGQHNPNPEQKLKRLKGHSNASLIAGDKDKGIEGGGGAEAAGEKARSREKWELSRRTEGATAAVAVLSGERGDEISKLICHPKPPSS